MSFCNLPQDAVRGRAAAAAGEPERVRILAGRRIGERSRQTACLAPGVAFGIVRPRSGSAIFGIAVPRGAAGDQDFAAKRG